MLVYLVKVTAVLYDIALKQFRASVFAFYALFIHLIGEACSSAIVGMLSYRYDLRDTLVFAASFVFLAGISFFQ